MTAPHFTETAEDRITRAHDQMKAMLLMLAVYYDNAEQGTTDTLPARTLGNYVWQLEQNLEAIKLGLEEMTDQTGGKVHG